MSDNNSAQPVYAAPPVYVAPPASARTNTLAIISLITSIVGIGIVGIITGHIGLSQIKKTHEQGRGMAIAGLVIGYVEVAGVLIFGLIFLITAIIVGTTTPTTY